MRRLFNITFLLALLSCAFVESKAQPWVARHGLTSSEYQSEFNKYGSQGFRLTYVSGYTVNDQPRFAALWEKKPGPAWVAHHGMTSSQYQSLFNKYAGQGFRLTLVNGYTVDDEARYVAIWEKKSGPPWVARHGMSSAEYQSEFNKYVGQGYRLTHVSGYSVDDKSRFAAIWEKKSGPAWVARHGMSSYEYQNEFNKYAGQGYRLVLVSGYAVDGKSKYAAIWEKSSGPAWVAHHDMNSAQYQKEFNYYTGCHGFKLKLVSGHTYDDKGRYAAIWERNGPPPAIAPPEAPTNLNIDNETGHATKLFLSWKDNSKCEEGFKIYKRREGSNNWQEAASVGHDVQGYKVAGLAPNTRYCFKVAAWNRGGSSMSKEACGKTMPSKESNDPPSDPPESTERTMKLRAFTTETFISKITGATFYLKGPNGFSKTVATSQDTSKSRVATVKNFSKSPFGNWEVRCVVDFEYKEGNVVRQGTLDKTFSEKWPTGKLVIFEYYIQKDFPPGSTQGTYVLKATQ